MDDDSPTLAAGGAVEDAPDRFDGYHLLRLRGAGGQGVVYEAVEEATGRRVAIKVLRSGRLASEEERTRFLREARLAGRLDDPHVVRVLGYGEVRELPYLVMELVDGRPLLEHLETRRPPLRDRVGLIVQACRGVAHAHRRGVIHRDLKPQNLLVTEDGRVKVVDFGTARLLEETRLTRTGQFVGTVRDAAPEQLSGGEPDTRTDVHGLGLLLHRLLTGRHPFEGIEETEGVSGLTRALVSRMPPAPSSQSTEVDRDLDAICLQALAKQPSERHGTVEALQKDLEDWLAGRPVAARKGGAAYRAWKIARRYPLRVAAGVAALSVVSLLVGVALIQGARAQREWSRAEREKEQLANLLDFSARLISVKGQARASGTQQGEASDLDAAYQYLSRESGRVDDPTVVKLTAAMGDLLLAAGRPDQAVDMLRHAIAGHRELGLDEPATLADLLVKQARGHLMMAGHEAAAASASQAVELLQERGGPAPGTAIEARQILVRVALAEGQQEHAFRLQDELDRDLGMLESGSPRRRALLLERCRALAALGRDAESLDLLERHFAARPLPVESRDAVDVDLRMLRGELLMKTGRLAEALPLLRAAVGLQHEVLGPDNPVLLRPVLTLASACVQVERWDEAAAWADDALRIRLSNDGPLHPHVPALRMVTAELHERAGRSADRVADQRRAAREGLARVQALGLSASLHADTPPSRRLLNLAGPPGAGAW